MRYLIRATGTAILIAAAACGPSELPASPGGDPAEETIARIVCRVDGSTELLTPRVTVRPDGLHASVRNLAGEPVSVGGLAVDAEEGMSEHVSMIPPGQVDVACWPYSQHGGRKPENVPMTVTDPDGYWVSPGQLECVGRTSTEEVRDYFVEAEGEVGDPVAIARRRLNGLQAGDVLRRTGYPEAIHAGVEVVRDGRTVALLGFIPAQGGGWLLGTQGACTGSGIRWKP